MKIKLDDGAFMPERAHDTDAGYDLRTPVDFELPAHGTALIDMGVHVELPAGACGILISKSGLNVRHNITSTGLIDEGYRGSIAVKLYNHGDDDLAFRRGDKISQLVITLYLATDLVQVDELSDTDRGENGFGSTGR